MSTFIVNVKKTGQMLSFDTSKLPHASVDYLIEYGLKQSLNDAHAGCVYKSKDGVINENFRAEAAVEVTKREAQIRSGAVPTSAGMPEHLVAVATSGLTPDEIMAAIEAAKNKKTRPAARA